MVGRQSLTLLMAVRIRHPEPMHNLKDYLSSAYTGKDVNVALLRSEGRFMYYLARWSVFTKRHRFEAAQIPDPEKPTVRVESVNSSQNSLYRVV